MAARLISVRTILATGAAALAFGAMAQAQAPGSPAPGAAGTEAPSAPSTPIAGTAAATAPSVPADPGIGEIVVTATRQEQFLSKVPVSVSAFSQQAMDLKGTKDIADVARFTPGLQVEDGSNQIAIRGIRSNAGAGTTGIYIDDTPIQIRNLGFNSDDSLPAIFDLDRVEVLRGPQGTLFGAGSEGGTVRYITPQPGLHNWSSYARAELATTQHGGASYEAGAALGGPIIDDKLGFRISAYHRRDGGWVDKVDNDDVTTKKNANSSDVTVLRGALTFQPFDALKITPTMHYQKRLTRDDDFYTRALSNPGKGVFRDSSPEFRRNPDRFILPSLNIDYDFGPVRMINNTSYFKRWNKSGYDGTIYDLSYYQGLTIDPLCEDNCATPPALLTPTGLNPDVAYYKSPSVVTNRQRIFTQELRFQSTNQDAPITWVAGFFYQNQRQLSREELVDPLGDRLFNQIFGVGIGDYFGSYLDPAETIPLYNGRDSYINESVAHEKQVAVFADVTWHPTEKLSVTAGGRYAKLTYNFDNFADGPQDVGRVEYAGGSKSKPFTPKFNVSYQLDRDNLFYGTYSEGFRPGGANPLIPPNVCSELEEGGGTRQYKPDRVKSVELGTKNKLFERKLSVAASVYQIRWKGIQNLVYLPSCAIQFIDNFGKARARGFDLQLTAVPVSGVTIDAAIGYTDARYIVDAVSPQVGLIATKGDAVEGPPWTLALGAQYDFPAFGQKAYVRGDYQYQSKQKRRTVVQDPDAISYNPDIARPEGTHFVSLRAGTIVAGANISLFVDNLLDSAPLLDELDNDSDFYTQRSWRPRTIGITATYRR